jgi:ankyrin repeat protein
LQISVRDGNFNGLDGLDPTVSWENSGKAGDLDISYGVEAEARPTTEIASLPRKLWGKASTDVSGWGVSARADIDAQNLDSAELEIDANNKDNDISVNMLASAGRDFNVRSVQATKGFDANGARVTVTPRLDLENDDRDVEINYTNDKTSVKLMASASGQEVTISQQVDGDNRIAPTVNSNGDLSVEWERRLSDDGALTATLKPNESLDVEWRDAAWTANVNMPIDGTNINGANVSMKRDVNF